MKKTFTKYPSTLINASENIAINKVKSEVSKKLKEKLQTILTDHEDNLAMVLHSDVSDYDPDWCDEDFSDDYENRLESIIDELVNLEISCLFKNAKK